MFKFYDISKIKNSILQGNTLNELKKLPPDSIDIICTSPPYYGLRSYLPDGHKDKKLEIGLENSFGEYLEKMLAITAELKRVLKKSGQFWLNMGDCYSSTAGGGTVIPIKEYMSPQKGKDMENKIRSGELKQYKAPVPAKCLLMQPERLAIAMIDRQGWILRNKVKWAKQVLIKKKNRTIGSVMPTSVKDRFNESGEEFYFFVKNKKYWSDLDAVRLPHQTSENRPDGIYQNRISNKMKEWEKKRGFVPYEEAIGKSWHNHKEDKTKGAGQKNVRACYPKGKNLPTTWNIQSEPHNFRKELNLDVEHFAIFPQLLIEIPIKFGCPKGGVVLDPFFGSGTVGVVSKKLGRNYIGIELNPDYIKIAQARIKKTVYQPKII